ncbi:MAG: hypothetical protein AAGC60_20420 [Acidobacteriota bacterium]
MISRPSAVVRLDGRAFDARSAGLLELRVDLGLARHDAATLGLAPGSPLDPSPGARLEIALGEAGAEEPVWSGSVIERVDAPAGLRVEALTPSHALSAARRAEVYLQQSVAQIVRDLVSDTVPINTLEGDLALDVYTVEPRRTVWDYVVELAHLADCVLSSTADGALRLVASGGSAGAIGGALGALGALAGESDALRRGAELLSWRLGPSSASSGPARALAAVGAASEQGATRWHWLRARPTPVGSVPAAGSPRLVGAVRTRAAAEQVAEGMAARRARGETVGELVAVGRPSLRPGQTVRVADLPSGDATLRLESVTHRLSSHAGFLTHARGVADAGSGALGGVGSLSGWMP